jgi:hypothetical protein
LIKKLFPKLLETVPVQSGEEFLNGLQQAILMILKMHVSLVKLLKRNCVPLMKIFQINSLMVLHIYDLLDSDSLQLLSNLLGDDWWWDKNPSLPNSHYVFLLDILKDVIAEFKKLDEVMV